MKDLVKVTEEYNLELKDKCIVGIHKGNEFGPKSKACIFDPIVKHEHWSKKEGIKCLASRETTLGTNVEIG